MGRLEKQIIAGALALVGLLVCVVVYRGLDRRPGRALEGAALELSASWRDPADQAELPPAAASAQVDAAVAGDSLEPLLVIPEPPARDTGFASAGADPAVIATPLQALPLAPDQLWDEEVKSCKVRPGDNLTRIARRELGSSAQVFLDEIRLLNEGLREDRLMPGQTIQLPGRGRVATLRAADVAAKREAAATPAATPAGTPPASVLSVEVAGLRRHTVVAGDTLWGLAEKYFGNGTLQDRIYAANRALLANQDVLRIGMVLVIPAP